MLNTMRQTVLETINNSDVPLSLSNIAFLTGGEKQDILSILEHLVEMNSIILKRNMMVNSKIVNFYYKNLHDFQ